MKTESIPALWLELALMDLRLKLLPQCFNRRLLSADTGGNGSAGDSRDKDEVLRIAQRLRAAAGHPFCFNMSCLRQALVLRSQLRARGIEAILVYGVNKNGSGFSAHAWVEAGGVSTNNAPKGLFRRFNA